YTYLLAYVILFTILGCFIEPIAIMVMTLPIMFPVMAAQGFDPIWLGVVSVKLAEIGVLTPPVGLNVFVVKSSSPVPVTLGQVFTGVMPFIAMAHGECDHAIARLIADEAKNTIEWLVERQVPLTCVLNFQYPGHSRPHMHAAKSLDGAELHAALLAAVEREEIPLATSAHA